MTNNEALIIAANYDVILEMTGIDFGYSLELLDESKKVKSVQDSLENIQNVLNKKLKPLQEKKTAIESDLKKVKELKAIEAEIKVEADRAQIEWDKVTGDEFTGNFSPIDMSKIPTESENLDKRMKDGISLVRSALLFLTRKGLVKK